MADPNRAIYMATDVLFDIHVGVRDSGAAAADPDRDSVMLTIRGGSEPHGVFNFDGNSLQSTVNASNTTLSLTVQRLAGTIGQYSWCSVWILYYRNDVELLEKVQRRLID